MIKLKTLSVPLAASLLTTWVYAAPSYTAAPLPIPSNASVSGIDINNSVEMAGQTLLTGYGQDAAYWPNDRQIQSLGLPYGMNYSESKAINDYGSVVGNYSFASGSYGVAVWTRGQVSEAFNISGAYGIDAADINNGGDIVGTLIFRLSSDPYPRPYTFIRSGGRTTVLVRPTNWMPNIFKGQPEASSSALFINNVGAIVGEVDGYHYYYNGQFNLLALEPAAMNDQGMIVGKDLFRCLSFNPETGASIANFDTQSHLTGCSSSDINETNVVVGQFEASSGESHGFVFDQSFYDLNSITSFSGQAAVITETVAINDNNVILAMGYYSADVSKTMVPFLLTPN